MNLCANTAKRETLAAQRVALRILAWQHQRLTQAQVRSMDQLSLGGLAVQCSNSAGGWRNQVG